MGRDPRSIPESGLAGGGPAFRTLAEAARAKCLDCCGGQLREVRFCLALTCPLWPFRMGTDPFRGMRGRGPENGSLLPISDPGGDACGPWLRRHVVGLMALRSTLPPPKGRGAILRPFVRPGAGTAALPGDLGGRLRVHRGRRASGRSRCAWWRASCGRGGCCGSGATSCWPCAGRRSRSAPTPCSSPTTPAPSWAASWRSAGRCRRGSSTCSPSSGRPPTACELPCGCGPARCAAVARPGRHGRRREDRDARPGAARRAVVAGRAPGDPGLLPGRRGRSGRTPPAHAAGHPRPPARRSHRARPSAAARPLHGRGRPHGVDRRPDRHRDAGAPAGRLGRDQGAADRGGRRATTASTRARTFKADRFAAYLAAKGIPWPRLPSGALALDDDTFRDMARAYPQLQPLRELRHALGELRLEALGRGRGRPQPLPALRLPLAHRPQPAQQHASSSSARRPGCAR